MNDLASTLASLTPEEGVGLILLVTLTVMQLFKSTQRVWDGSLVRHRTKVTKA